MPRAGRGRARPPGAGTGAGGGRADRRGPADGESWTRSRWTLRGAGRSPAAAVEPAGEPSVVELESLILDDPDNADLHLQLADRLLDGGEEGRGLEELELALAGYERLGDWPARVGDRRAAHAAGARHHPAPPEAGRARVPLRRAGPAARGLSRPGRCAGPGRRHREGDRGLRAGAGARSRQRARAGARWRPSGARPSAGRYRAPRGSRAAGHAPARRTGASRRPTPAGRAPRPRPGGRQAPTRSWISAP